MWRWALGLRQVDATVAMLASLADAGTARVLSALRRTVGGTYQGVPFVYRFLQGRRALNNDAIAFWLPGTHPQFLVDRDSAFMGGRDLFAEHEQLATIVPKARLAAADPLEAASLLSGTLRSKLIDLMAVDSFLFFLSIASDHPRLLRIGIPRPAQHPQTAVVLGRYWSGQRQPSLREDFDHLLESARLIEKQPARPAQQTESAPSFIADRAAAMIALLIALVAAIVGAIFLIGYLTG